MARPCFFQIPEFLLLKSFHSANNHVWAFFFNQIILTKGQVKGYFVVVVVYIYIYTHIKKYVYLYIYIY